MIIRDLRLEAVDTDNDQKWRGFAYQKQADNPDCVVAMTDGKFPTPLEAIQHLMATMALDLARGGNNLPQYNRLAIDPGGATVYSRQDGNKDLGDE